MKKKIIIYSQGNSVRCLFEVQTDNITPRNGDIQHPGGMRMSLFCWRKTSRAGLGVTLSHSRVWLRTGELKKEVLQGKKRNTAAFWLVKTAANHDGVKRGYGSI